ncbi:MAG: ABC transporter ATP-binding protein [Oscillospiraceae bacterium]|jgi:iron complex transport system ATP-binding protein|nr:ABC transporter ATP-binding protein [Oscillospiraceae bacterium]
MKEVIHTQDLNVGYDKKTVISDVKINALKGQVICLIGPNGAGKSTILRTLAGMLAPVNGTVYIGQEDIHSVRPGALAKQMAVVLTEKLNVNMTSAYEVAAMGRTPYTGFFGKLTEDDHRIVSESMQTVGAMNLAGRDFLSLSDGEKQKVLIARALAQEPQLIVLDEPTSHLDIKHKIEVMRILNRLSNERGMTVILALHDVDIAVKSCQFVLLVKDGKIMAQGRPEDVVGKDTISSLYDIEGAMFDSVMGSLEICNEKSPDVFVASGAGTGTPVFRLLSRMGYGVVTGILHKNDIDCHIAESMKLTIVSEECFEPVTDTNRAVAADYLNKTAFAIDTNFPLGTYNCDNIELLRSSVKPVFSLRSPGEIERLYGNNLNVTYVSSVGRLQEQISGLSAV